MKTFFELQGAYKGLRVRRLKRFGRIVLDRVISARPNHPEVCGMDYDPIVNGCPWSPGGSLRFALSMKNVIGRYWLKLEVNGTTGLSDLRI